jgi:DNA-binding beta-propeller fold protein YncE
VCESAVTTGYSKTVAPTDCHTGPYLGGMNGLFFDNDNNLLWVLAQVLRGRLSKIDPKTGEVLEEIGAADGPFFSDDMTVDDDGAVYWTDVVRGTVFAKDPITTRDVTPFFDRSNNALHPLKGRTNISSHYSQVANLYGLCL